MANQRFGLFFIYRYTNTLNGKIYIGLTVNIKERHRKHFKESAYMERAFYRAVRKYGWAVFDGPVVIDTANCLESAQAKETLWIDRLRTFVGWADAHGYNMTTGGQFSQFAPESLEKIRISKTGNRNPQYGMTGIKSTRFGKSHTAETKAKLSVSSRYSFLGQKHSEETKAKIGASNKGKTVSLETRQKLAKYKGSNASFYGRSHTPETKEKMRNAQLGKVLSEETKQKLASYSGTNAAWYGRKHTPETRAKMSESGRRAWLLRKETQL